MKKIFEVTYKDAEFSEITDEVEAYDIAEAREVFVKEHESSIRTSAWFDHANPNELFEITQSLRVIQTSM